MTRQASTGVARGCLGLIAVALALASLGGCGVDRRSSVYRCDNQSDCSGERVCQQGWCVVPGIVDAGPPPGCPAVCAACVSGTCVIECEDAQDCLGEIQCPPGLDCDVTCVGDQRCAGGVDCSQADDCTVDCDGTGACGGGVICGTGACSVECGGLGACLGGIDCSASCACDTDCEIGCGELSCPGGAGQCERNGECSSAGCNSC